jgi:hypothetical protein
MMRKTLCALLAALWLAVPAFSQSSLAGTRAFPFLNLDFDSRTIAMGGASVAMPNDLYGIVYNPAAAGYITKRQAVCGYRSIVEDVWGAPLGYAMPYANYGVFGIHLLDVSFGSLKEKIENPIDGTPLETGVTWKSYAVAGGLTWSKIVWENLSLGGSLKGIYHYIGSNNGNKEYYSASAVALQAGMQYRWLGSRVITGLVLDNAGFMVADYTDQTENLKLPFSVTAGVSYSPEYVPSLRIALDLQQPADGFLIYKLGGELAIYKKYFLIRAGYAFSEPDLEAQLKVLKGENNDSYQKSNWAGLSFGVGLNTTVGMTDVGIDAALQLLDNIDPAFGISLMAGF